MLALNRSLLNMEYILINVSFDRFYVQSPCNFLIEHYTEIFYAIYKWNVSSIQCKMVENCENSKFPESLNLEESLRLLIQASHCHRNSFVTNPVVTNMGPPKRPVASNRSSTTECVYLATGCPGSIV
jgi:hypothetical protein